MSPLTHRIRAATIIIHEEKILLVKHVHPVTHFAWWVPPGGGVEAYDTSIRDCARREVFEETGYDVDVRHDVRFVREYFDKEHHVLNIELFFLADIVSGEMTVDHIPQDSADRQFIKDVQWCTQDQLREMVLYPEILQKNFGRDVDGIYLGRQVG